MKLLKIEDFFAKTSKGRPPKMDTIPYNNHYFKCACGDSHEFNSNSIEVIRELSKMRLVVLCPQDENYITCIKVKGIFKFKGFESLFGCKGEEPNDKNTEANTNESLSKIIYKELSEIKTYDEYQFLILQTIGKLSIDFERAFNYHNIDKIDIVFTNLFAKYSDNLTFNKIEETKHYEILQLILMRHEKYDLQEIWSHFIESLKYFSNLHNQIDFTKKDASQVLFTTSQMYAKYLYPDKQDFELLEVTMALVEWASAIGMLATYQKNFLN